MGRSTVNEQQTAIVPVCSLHWEHCERRVSEWTTSSNGNMTRALSCDKLNRSMTGWVNNTLANDLHRQGFLWQNRSPTSAFHHTRKLIQQTNLNSNHLFCVAYILHLKRRHICRQGSHSGTNHLLGQRLLRHNISASCVSVWSYCEVLCRRQPRDHQPVLVSGENRPSSLVGRMAGSITFVRVSQVCIHMRSVLRNDSLPQNYDP